MKIALLSPSIYMSRKKYPDMIFAPRDLVIALADGLVSRGHEVWLFASPDTQTKAKLVPGDDDLLQREYVEAKLKSDQSERLKWSSFYGLKKYYETDLVEKCYKMAKNEHFDIIHSYHDPMAHFFDELSDVPTVYTLHDPLPTEPNDLIYWLYRKFSQHKYISISDAFRRTGSLTLNFVKTIYHGINLTYYPITQMPQNYLMAMGRMVPEKGLDDAIDVSAATHTPLQIATSDMAVNTHIPFYHEVIEPKMQQNPTVSFTGFLDGQRKAERLGGAKALLFPIKWEEPFGMVMIEAMACGTPVIAYNRGSVAEIVKDGVTGFIIDSDDNDSGLAARQPQIHPQGDPGSGAPRLASPEKSTRIIKKTGIAGLVEAINRIGEIDRQACRKHVEEMFTDVKMTENHEKLYQEVIAANKK
jgi:glycosyltransferase involved in cell wall biosynthesis